MNIKIGAEARTESHAPAKNIHQPLIEDFTKAVLSGSEPALTGEIGRQIALLEEEIYRN